MDTYLKNRILYDPNTELHKVNGYRLKHTGWNEYQKLEALNPWEVKKPLRYSREHLVRLAGIKSGVYNPVLPTLRKISRDDVLCKLSDEHSRHMTYLDVEEFNHPYPYLNRTDRKYFFGDAEECEKELMSARSRKNSAAYCQSATATFFGDQPLDHFPEIKRSKSLISIDLSMSRNYNRPRSSDLRENMNQLNDIRSLYSSYRIRSALLYQRQQLQHSANHHHQLDLDSNNTGVRLVHSGKVYRQLFEAQVQLSDAYDKVKLKQEHHPAEIRVPDEGIPLVKEGRGLRGVGILDQESDIWVHASSNDIYVNNPVFHKYKTDEKIQKLGKIRRKSEKDEVSGLPDTVVPKSLGSDIEARIEISRKKKHNECWEDMIQEVALINLNLEPKIRKAGKLVLQQLGESDKHVETLLDYVMKDGDVLASGSAARFDEFKKKLLRFSEVRKDFIDCMDASYLSIEDERVQRIRGIFNKYAQKLFQIAFMKNPDIEKIFDAEIQQLNNQILMNKSCYTQLYVKLITADIEREKNQINLIESKQAEWRQYALAAEINKLSIFVDNLNTINPEKDEEKVHHDLIKEQQATNEIIVGLIKALETFKPPESTKTAVYKWLMSVKEYSKHLEQINTNFVTDLRASNEESNQRIINEMEATLKTLIESRIVGVEESKEVLEEKLLPIWSRKQKGIEAYIEKVEAEFEEVSQMNERELNGLFKWLQGLGHIWDMHEIGLVKKERGLQELLQDCRKDHDSDNLKREEKLDGILDQMREASAEKDLKRLMANVSMQLESIERSYRSFSDVQLELVRRYPEMVRDELQRYEDHLMDFFSLRKANDLEEELVEEDRMTNMDQNSKTLNSVLEDSLIKSKIIKKPDIISDRGTRFVIINNQSSVDSQQKAIADNLTEKSGMTVNSDVKRLLHNTTDNASTRSLITQKDTNLDENNTRSEMIFALDELIPNTRTDIMDIVDTKSYLRFTAVRLSLLDEARNKVRLSFLNHLEAWFEEGVVRSSSIVAAKSTEIEKELALRLHLHEPRLKRAEMDVHNVRASEIIMHDERVERHVAAVNEAIDKIKVNFEATQAKLGDMSQQNKVDVFNLEMAFLNASKSKILTLLHEQLNKQRDCYMDSVKATLRTFRSEMDEQLSFLRSSNAKFRVSFQDFTTGGNFSSDEIESHKKRLEKLAQLLDNCETNTLKELEKIEKRYTDEAIKVILQFQEKFKYHLVDLQFIEKISRWLNETQIKIKTLVNGSNLQAKKLSEHITEFEKRLDCCQHPNLDKSQVLPKDLVVNLEELNLEIYERGFYLKCFKGENVVPEKFLELFGRHDEMSDGVVIQGSMARSLGSGRNLKSEATGHEDGTVSSMSKKDKEKSAIPGTPSNNSVPLLKSNSKVVPDDAALTIMKTILVNNIQDRQKDLEMLGAKSESSIHGTSARLSTKSKSKVDKEKAAKNKLTSNVNEDTDYEEPDVAVKTRTKYKNLNKFQFDEKLLSLAQVKKIMAERRAKTRDEMFSYYCVFGETPSPGKDFKSLVNNILRDTLEGILTNSEIFYREIQQQNRHPTRPESIKESYVDFAESMILKLKSYMTQCDTYHNQCLKEFRDSLTTYEKLTAAVPALVINEIFQRNSTQLHIDIRQVHSKNLEMLSKFDVEKATNESMLKPNLGHPNAHLKLDQLNKKELDRQQAHQKAINHFTNQLREAIGTAAEVFLKELATTNENLLLKFDEILTEDEVFKPEVIPAKHPCGELIRRKKAGLPLEDGEPEPLIKREKGSWKGVESYDILVKDGVVKEKVSAGINTAKTTLAHKSSSDETRLGYEKFRKVIEENFGYLKSMHCELGFKVDKWTQYWSNSVKQIRELYE